jgi:hypothetical protein
MPAFGSALPIFAGWQSSAKRTSAALNGRLRSDFGCSDLIVDQFAGLSPSCLTSRIEAMLSISSSLIGVDSASRPLLAERTPRPSD